MDGCWIVVVVGVGRGSKGDATRTLGHTYKVKEGFLRFGEWRGLIGMVCFRTWV